MVADVEVLCLVGTKNLETEQIGNGTLEVRDIKFRVTRATVNISTGINGHDFLGNIRRTILNNPKRTLCPPLMVPW